MAAISITSRGVGYGSGLGSADMTQNLPQSTRQRFLARLEDSNDRLDVKHAATPGAAADLLERGPEARLGRQVWIRRQVLARRPRREHPRALLRAEDPAVRPDEVHRTGEPLAVDDDLDQVAVAHLAGRPAGERFGRDVPDAGAGRNAAEPRVRDHGYVLAE